MKETQQHSKDTIEIVKETKQEKKQVLIGSIRPHQNHLCFEFNYKTGNIELAKFTEQDVLFKEGSVGSIKKKVVVNENCLYATALNIKNAKKKFEKMLTA